jgi:GT2 family glycosyltransferase
MQVNTDQELSIIIVNWKVRDLLRDCLHSLFSDSPGADFEIIVVDNNSDDGSTEMVEREFPKVRLISNRANVGFGAACNQGIRVAQGGYLLILNPDTLVEPKSLLNAVEFMESHPKVGIGGCYLYYPDGRSQTSFYRFTTLASALGRAWLLCFFVPRNRLTAPLFLDYLSPRRPVQRVCGGAMVIRREVIEEVGAFDESFFLYSEEEDLCYRAARQGWRISPIPDTRVIHHHGQSGKKNIRLVTYSSYRSQLLFYQKHHPLYKTILLRLIQFTGLAIRSCYWLLREQVTSNQISAHQRFASYLSLLLSDFHYTRSLVD